MFEDVVEILDPEMNIDSEIGEDEMQVEEMNCSLPNKMRIIVVVNCNVTICWPVITVITSLLQCVC